MSGRVMGTPGYMAPEQTHAAGTDVDPRSDVYSLGAILYSILTLRSPVKGTVKRVLVNTVGGVVQPGKDVIEIVPLEDNLLLEARVQPRDIAFLRPGQKVVVKFTAYDFSIYGGLDGKLEHIGADSVVDEKGNAYYTVRVRTNKPTLGNNLPVIPGMIVEVDIITGEKSVLTYLLKPVLRAKARALSER